MAKQTDCRVRRTKTQLCNALAELMEQKKLSEITVTELVQKADINRSTFYLHYKDIYDMLITLEQELIEKIETVLNSRSKEHIQIEDTFPMVEDIFRILYENRKLCKALLGHNIDPAFMYRIEQLIANQALCDFRSMLPDNLEPVRYSFSFCITGCIGLIKRWLDDEKSTASPEEMARLTHHILNDVFHDYLNTRLG